MAAERQVDKRDKLSEERTQIMAVTVEVRNKK